MIYLFITNGNVAGISETHQNGGDWQSRWNWKDFETVQKLAEGANKLIGSDKYVAVDSGPCVSPRYDVIEAPCVGAKVSYGFNGDYYPDGEIIAVTKGTLKVVTTSTGSRYYRRGNSGRWVKAGGTWSLVPGHIDERNPSF